MPIEEYQKRLVIRGEVTSWNAMLVEAAHNAGITDQVEYAQFQNVSSSSIELGVAQIPISSRISGSSTQTNRPADFSWQQGGGFYIYVNSASTIRRQILICKKNNFFKIITDTRK